MNNKTLAQIIQNNIRVKNLEAESGSGGEVWEDITNLFTPTSSSSGYHLSNANYEEFIDIPLRITIELSVSSEGYSEIRGSTQVYINVETYTGISYLSTNTIYNYDDSSFSGFIMFEDYTILYMYGVNIPEENDRPKILKVERLAQ